MKNIAASVVATTGVAVTMVLGGAAPAMASPTTDVARSSQTTVIAPILGIGAGSYQWWCTGFPSTCKYITIRDNWGGVYRAKCLDFYCKNIRIVG